MDLNIGDIVKVNREFLTNKNFSFYKKDFVIAKIELIGKRQLYTVTNNGKEYKFFNYELIKKV